jgi:hypothetical protein
MLVASLPENRKSAGFQNIVPVNFSHAVFSLLDFLTLEDGTDGLSRNVGTELPLYAAQYLRGLHTSHDYLVMQTLVWLHMVQFRAIWFGTVWFSASYANIRRPHIFKHQI